MSTQKQTKRSRMKRAAHAFGRTVQHYSPKVLSVFLSLLLIYQCFMTDGVSYALAEALNSNTATELSLDQENLSDDAVSDSGQEESAVTSSQEETAGSEETSQSGDASSTNTANDQTTSPSNTSTSEQTDNKDEQQNTTSNNDQSDTAQTEQKIAERTEVHSWNGDVDALALSSKGLTFTNSSESMQSALSGNADSSDTQNQNLSETLSVPADPDAPASAETILPEQLDATLNLSFKVDPSLWSDNPEQTRASVIAGDSFSVELPEGITPSDANAKFDVYQINADGSTSSIRIATARVENNSLIVTFSDPVDTATGTSYLVGAASDSSDLKVLSTLQASINLDVQVSSSLVHQDAYDMEWVLQTSQDGRTQTAQLHIPSAAELADLLGLPDASDQSAQNNAVIPNNDVSTQAETDEKTSYAFADYNGTLSMDITWADNNYAGRPTIEAWKPNFIPQFSLDGGKTYTNLIDTDGNLTSEAKDALHIEGETPSWVKQATVNSVSVNNWTVRFSGLPTTLNTTVSTPQRDDDGNLVYDEHGNLVYDDEVTPTTISWRLFDGNSCPENYMYGQGDGGNTSDGSTLLQRYLMLKRSYTFTIQGKLGNKTLKDIFGENLAGNYSEDFLFSALINNSSEWNGEPIGSQTLTQMATNDDYDFDIAFSEDGNTATITATLPMYTIENAPIDYYIQFEDQQTGTDQGDHYQPTYNNSPTSGHGSATDALYNNGSMTIRPIGNTSYSATKDWLDGNSTQRGEVTFTLWRYAANGTSGPAQASPVQLDNSITPDTDLNTVEYVSITVSANSPNPVDLGSLLREKYGSAIDNLVKYDPDGYPYIYALREDTKLPGYEEVYGTVDASGNVTDTAPNYTDADGQTVYLNAPDRANDPLIYNGGTVTNRLTGTVNVEATKTWEIAAFQDSLKDVQVTFTAQSRLKGTEDAWQDTSTTHTLTGWYSETLTQTFSDTFPQYDSQGRELEYRWVETNVTLNDQDTNFQRNDNGGGTFTLQLTNVEGDLETLNFTSTLDEDTKTITNTFSNITDEHVDKYWQQPDGSMAQIKPANDGYPDYPNLDTSGVVTVQLVQNGTLIGEYTMDGLTDPVPTEIVGLDGATYQETRSYHIDFANLPKYDANGIRYSYLVLEVSPSGWHSERTYDPETRLTTIENTVGPGEGSEIRVTKDWIDGNDASHRLPVVVDLVATHHMESQTTNEQGEPLYSYDAGDVVIPNITLSTDNSWYQEVDVPIGGLTYRDFKLVEKYLVGSDGTQYPVVTKNEAPTAYENLGIDTDWINTGWDYDAMTDTSRVATPDHVYQVYATKDAAATYNESMSAVSARNRRLGLRDLTVTKTWNDGFDHDRPTAELVLSCTEEPDVFSIDNNGNVWVELDGGNQVPIMNGSGEGARQLNSTTDDIRLDGNNLVLTVTTPDDENESEYHFFGLPKYDGNGNVVHYDVTEQWATDAGEYTSSKQVGDYIVGAQHFHDTKTISFTNTRQASRDVTFYKNWNDHYVNDQLSQRPDIYLTLYRVTVTLGENNQPEYSAAEKVPGYINYKWDGVEQADNPQYNQKCTIAGLPAYDSKGNEYIYYASESMSADGNSLDYAPVKFDYGTLPEDSEGKDAIKVDSAADDADPTENGSAYAIHEEGTFVNSLTSTLVASGAKLWGNIPGNVSQADLPSITIYLQRKLATDADWPELTFTKTDDGWQPGEGQVVAWTSHLNPVTTNQFSYTLTHEGENGADPKDEEGTLLARYDEDGNLYQYRAIEVPWGLYNQPGGFNDADLGLVDGKTETEDVTQITTFGVVTIHHGETGSFLINNVYDSAAGQLTVQKHFDGRDAGDLYPNTTFDVYRYYINSEGQKSDAALVASHTLTNDDLTGKTQDPNLTVSGSDANNTAQYTFTDLDIYAPDGSYWQYYVVERDINGYTTYVGTGNLTADQTTTEGSQSDNLCPESQDKVTGTVLSDDKEPDVTFKNTYQPEDVDLTGRKTWVDFSNTFGLRPTAEEFKAGLTVYRIGNGRQEDITDQLQSNKPDEANYFTVADTGDTYTISLNNLEKWAPDGTAWQYRITEDLSSMNLGDSGKTADDYYTITTGPSSTVSANSNNQFQLVNSLEGQAAVTKIWVDGDDPYGLRPDEVTVRLQARVNYANGDQIGWTDVWALFEQLGYSDSLASQGTTSPDYTHTLSDSNGWRTSWTGLPVGGRGTATGGHEGELFSIEYRIVETAIGDQTITQPTEDSSVNNGDIYKDYHPYQPTQSDSSNPTTGGFTSEITNTLEGTSISASKSWNDQSDAWGTRPRSGDPWTVKYLLQRKLTTDPDTAWSWLMEYGEEQATSPLDENIVSETISSEDESATVTWDNLPQYDTDENEYQYRVVEQVPGSYDVDGAKEVATAEDDNGITYRYYVVSPTVDGTGSSTQSFTNVLCTVNLQGTKVWSDDGSNGIIPSFDETKPTMVLYRAVKNADGSVSSTGELVKMKNGSDPVQPTWEDKGNGTWTFTYSNLPAANENNQDYVYYATEQAGTGSAEGFYPLYATSGAGGTNAAENPQIGTTITNQPTRLTLTKKSDFAGETKALANIELSVLSPDGQITYAVWTNGANGMTYSTTTWVDGTTNTDDGNGITRDDGLIIGLPAGDYIVRETGTVPKGYAQAADVNLHINTDGTATTTSDVTYTEENGVYTINVAVIDPVLRGQLQLSKRVSDDGDYNGANAEALAGATFALYRVDMDGDGEDELLASGLTTNNQGIVTTVNNQTPINTESTLGHDLTYEGKYTKLSDGLPEGKYYFLETNATSGAVMPEGDAAKSEILEITQNTHYAATNTPVSATMGNEDFSAEVILHKYDTVSGDPIEGAVFQLVYTSEGGTSSTSKRYTTAPDGTLTLQNLEKGTYVLTELSNTGYESNNFSATFTIDNDDDDKTFDIKNVSDGDDIDFTVTSAASTFEDGKGIPNTPQPGRITLSKTDDQGNALNDATFRLEINDGGTWKTVVDNLVTGRTYTLNDANDGIKSTGANGVKGQLSVGNLHWGTYRFVETSPTPGYIGVANDGSAITSKEVAVGRNNLNPSLTGSNAVPNKPTSLEINKQNEVHQPLAGAEFKVTPVDGTFADDTTTAKTLTSDSTGLAVLNGQLVVGTTYQIFESKGPSGYDPADEILTIKVAENGDLEVVGDMPDHWERADLNGDGAADNQFSFMATNFHMDIQLLKISAADGTPLNGATFTLTGFCMDNNSTHTYTTADITSDETTYSGVALIDAGLITGVDYTLTETQAPAGYIHMTSPLKFHMDERGEITVEGEVPEGWTIAGNNISITAENTPVELQITKLASADDETPGKALAGATFSITPADGSTFANGSQDAIELTTDKDGKVNLTAQLMVGGSYDITEVTAPDGYERVTGTMRISVANDGSLSVVGSVDADGNVTGQLAPNGYTKVADNSFEVQVTNEPIEIGLVKVDATDSGTTLADAQFEITGVFAGQTESETRSYTTDEQGKLTLKAELKSGQTYTLHETVAPAGYELVTGELTFSVAEDGTLTATGDIPAGYSIEQNNVTIVVADEPLKISLAKVNTDGDELAGAQFRITPESGTFPDGSEEKVATSASDGSVFTDLMVTGSSEGTRYTVTEVTAPAGYEKVPAFDILVFEDGSIQLADDTSDAIKQAVQIDMSDNGATITVADTLIEASMSKVSPNGGALTGAVFEISGTFVDGGAPRLITFDETNTVALEGLVVGETYTIRETKAPDGYDVIEGEWSFTVQDDGTLAGDATGSVATFTTGGEAGYFVSDNGLAITAVDTTTPPDNEEDREDSGVLPFIPKTGDPTTYTFVCVLAALAVGCIATGLRMARKRRS